MEAYTIRKCALEGFAGIKCSEMIHLHHIISFTQARGNKRVRKILKGNPEELTAWVCSAHNVGRWADSRKARAILLRKRNKETDGKTKETIDNLPWKVRKYSDSYEAMT